jgi:SnoaL-like domain
MWEACSMPWLPELFTAPAQQQLLDKQRRDELLFVPYFDGLLTGQVDALVESFAGEPQLHTPVRGRVKGVRAFEAFITETNEWLAQRNALFEDVERVITEQRGFEEVLLRLDGETGRVDLTHALVADHSADGRLEELRIYFSSWPLTGRHATRPPLLQPDPELRESDVVAEYQRALAAGDVDAILAAFEPDGYAREPAGGEHVHRGPDGLRDFYKQLFSNDGGIPLEHCAVVDDGRACALEYNVVRWGKTELPPQAGVAIYVRGESGKLAAARIYDDADPPLA